jgi:hypothetical protein
MRPFIAQLRTGYAEMSAMRMGEAKQLAASEAANCNGPPLAVQGTTPAGVAQRVPPVGLL